MTNKILRDYQREAIDSMYDYWAKKSGNPLIVAPCGAGKSLIISQFIKEAMQYTDTRILVLCHRKELLQQNAEELKELWPEAPIGFYSAGLNQKNKKQPITFANIQSISKKIHTFEAFDLVLIDECHLVSPNSNTQYAKTLETLYKMKPNLKVCGFTATPIRLDTGVLCKGLASKRVYQENIIFDDIIYEISVPYLVNQGYLCPVVGKSGNTVADLKNVKKNSGGEFIERDVASAMGCVTEQACNEIVQYGQDRKAWLIYTAGIEHAENVKEKLEKLGVNCSTISSKTPKNERELLIEQFKQNQLKCLINCDILTIGFNAPVCDMCVLLRATASTALYIQIVGRCMRVSDDKKDALLLDYGQNVERHGPIDDVKPRTPSDKDSEAPAKPCPYCNSIVALSTKYCPDCGFEFEFNNRPKFDNKAYDGAVMKLTAKPKWFRVDEIRYKRHEKPGKPDSVQVIYYCGSKTIKEWLCFDHDGYAKRKAFSWCAKNKCDTIPANVDMALEKLPEKWQPLGIKVFKDDKFYRVQDYYYDEEEAAIVTDCTPLSVHVDISKIR